jgi:molecular chaperone DnaK (HSP70)
MMIASSSGLSDKEVERMVSDAEEYAETDKNLIEQSNRLSLTAWTLGVVWFSQGHDV